MNISLILHYFVERTPIFCIRMIIFLEVMVVFKLSSSITHSHAFAFDIQSFTVSLLRAVDLINLFLFSEEKNLIKPEKAEPLKELLSFLQHVIEGKCQAIYHCYQLYWITPLWASIQSFAESLWQVVNGAVDTTFAGKFNLIT